MDIRKLSDFELVERFVKGDDDSMEILIRRHKSKVFTYLMLSVRNRDVANDLFQDTFMKVIQSLRSGRYSDEGKFLPWVVRIAHNLTIDYFRKEKNQNTWSNDDNELDIFNSPRFSDVNVEDRIVEDQICTDIRNLIDMLPDDQKQVVLLRHYGGMSFKEIADQTGVSINTALGRMRYAVINMRRFVDEYNITLTRN
ncbi:MAG: sigma-70 family RNA polymerase sigma factor [Bacteroidales bacterium]|nr:sigma-70 family RNA polymerase sigma factor [Bacteroidales bacterium]HQP04734.1 sigma-70 family RNA polymerase sigma factor [Bacteroidales bacterium]